MALAAAVAAITAGAVVDAATTSSGPAPGECHGETVCPVGQRGYHALLPDDWDGTSKLPVLMHFHGWKRQGDGTVKHGRIAGATRAAGVLLIAPNGLGRTWNFWRPGTPDVAFALEVLEDAAKRWPIDESRIFVSGYSYGSAMAWRFACEQGDRLAGLLAIGGTLADQAEECPTGPVHVRHVHGLADTVMDFPFGPDGEETYPVMLWREKNGCPPDADRISAWSVPDKYDFTRYEWLACESGKSVVLDVHARGHFIPIGWIARQLGELL